MSKEYEITFGPAVMEETPPNVQITFEPAVMEVEPKQASMLPVALGLGALGLFAWMRGKKR